MIPPYTSFNVYVAEIPLEAESLYEIERFEKAREGWAVADKVRTTREVAEYVVRNKSHDHPRISSDNPKTSDMKFGIHVVDRSNGHTSMLLRPLSIEEMRILSLELNKALRGQ